MNVKICGIRGIESAHAAQEAGATHLGLNFIASSRRLVSPQAAAQIASELCGKLHLVGVFQNMPLNTVNDIIALYKLDYAQLHGNESPTYCSQVNAPVIKTIAISASDTVDGVSKQMNAYTCELFLLDRAVQGSGEMINGKFASQLTKRFLCFIAGGLTPKNVASVVGQTQPYGVDVAGGIEANGIPDLQKIKQLIANAKGGTHAN